MTIMITWIGVLILAKVAASLPMHYFFNPSLQNNSNERTFVVTEGINVRTFKLEEPVIISERPFYKIFIWSDGFVTFKKSPDVSIRSNANTMEELVEFVYTQMRPPLIAVFMAQLDLSTPGARIRVRNILRGSTNCRDIKLIARIEQEIRSLYGSSYNSFVAKQITAITWDQVKLKNTNMSPVSFELGVVTDGGSQSFAIFNYNISALLPNFVAAGIFPRSGYGMQFILPQNFAISTNAALKGMWIAKMSVLTDRMSIQPAETRNDALSKIRTSHGFNMSAFTSCQNKDNTCDGAVCNLNAVCESQLQGGSCCRCKIGFTAVGQMCVNARSQSTPLRILYEGELRINEKRLTMQIEYNTADQFVQLQVYGKGAKRYKPFLNALYGFLSGNGLLFAEQSENSRLNIYTLSNGAFDRNLELDMNADQILVTQKGQIPVMVDTGLYKGILNTTVSGEISSFIGEKEFQFYNYGRTQIVFKFSETKNSQTQLQSNDNKIRGVLKDESGLITNFTLLWVDTYRFDKSCRFDVTKNDEHVVLNVKNYEIQNVSSLVIRMQVNVFHSVINPCSEDSQVCLDPMSMCVITSAEKHECQCINGYTLIDDMCSMQDTLCNGKQCVLNSVCQEMNRTLTNQLDCICEAGYKGDGNIVCSPDPRDCRLMPCATNKQCIFEKGDGKFGCREKWNNEASRLGGISQCSFRTCHKNAVCRNNTYCECKPGYIGDGETCQKVRRMNGTCNSATDCGRISLCHYGRCTCPNGTMDKPSDVEGLLGIKCLQCNIDGSRARCHENADCVDNSDGIMICKCREGFLGDGFYCRSSCSSSSDCAANATCQSAQCVCPIGYSGNPMPGGRGCALLVGRCFTDLDCAVNAKCISERCQCVRGFSGDPRRQGSGCRMEKCRSLYDCAENADCLNGKCTCNEGYSGDARLYGIGGCISTTCTSDSDCLENAECRSRNCLCMSGFSGDGRPGGRGCLRDSCIDYLDCVENGDCVNKTCICAPGFIGNAKLGSEGCQPGCSNAANCAENAVCSKGKCLCPKGFEGNPNFEQEGCRLLSRCSVDAECAANAQCHNGNCSCFEGFSGDPLIGGCTSQIGAKSIKSNLAVCTTNADCSTMATCKIISRNISSFSQLRCVCNDGFEGDGVKCKRSVLNKCETKSDCHRNASCLQEDGGRICRCNKGFSGNGTSICVSSAKVEECISDVDCQQPNFRCTQGKCHCALDCEFCVDDSQCHPQARCIRSNTIDQNSANRRCACPDGFFGDGKNRCDRCETDIDCQLNAQCVNLVGRRDKDCACNTGYLDNGRRECDAQPLIIQTESATQIKYENQSAILKCKVISGPANASDLQWRSSREEAIDIFASNRVAVSIEENQRVLTLSKLQISDSGMYYCSIMGMADGSTASVNLTVLKNPCPICHVYAHCNSTYGFCQCNRGYKGNGVSVCTETSCAADRTLCTPEQNCRFTGLLQKFSCVCKDGFLSQGDQCVRPNRPDFCLNNAECHEQAFCARQAGERRCKCKIGFEGDGKMECLPISVNCRFNNKCHVNATCKFTQNDYQCVCNSGYIGLGDVDCQTQVNCNQSKACGYFAKCIDRSVTHRNEDGVIEDFKQGKCTCNDGDTLVGNECYGNDYLTTDVFVAFGTYIIRIPIISNVTKTSHVFLSDSMLYKVNETDARSFLSSSIITAIAADCSTGDIYWASYDRDIIYRTSSVLPEGNRQQNKKNWIVIAENITGVEGLAFDWKTGNLFYTANYVDNNGESIGEIGVINRIGKKSYRKVFLNGNKNNIIKPREIVLNSAKGIIVWTDWDRKSPRIMQANMDGSNQVVLLQNMKELPNGLTIDNAGDICYAAASQLLCRKKNCTIFNHSRIRCISKRIKKNKSNKNISTIYYSQSGQPYALAAYKNLYFWTNWQDSKLYSINRESKKIKTYASPIASNSRMYGLAILPKQCPNNEQKSTACAIDRNYGNCKYICLTGQSGAHTCLCPDNLTRCFPSKDQNYKQRLMK